MKFGFDFRLSLMGAAGAAMLLASSAIAAPSSQMVSLTTSVAPFSSDVKVLSAAPSSATVHFAVNLRLRDMEGLRASNHANRKMPWSELAAKHLPTAADYDRVLNYLSDAGLTIDSRNPSRMSVHVSGAVPVVSRVLGVHMSTIESEGRRFVATADAPVLPASLDAVVLSISGLQPHLHADHTMVKPAAVEIGTDSATAPPYFPQAYLTAYHADGVGNGGLGTTTAIVIDSFPIKKDLQKFWKLAGVQGNIKNISFIDVNGTTMNPPSGEESMDVQTASSVAPKSKVVVYASDDLFFSSLDTTFERIISDQSDGKAIDQISVSLGSCEALLPKKYILQEDQYFAVLASQGSSIMLSSGDYGSRGYPVGGAANCKNKKLNPSWFATSPEVTAVGGTHLTFNKGKPVEVAWSLDKSDSRLISSGGGVSGIFKAPDYQKTLGFKGRAVPDISADGDPNTGTLLVLNGKTYQFGGTSLSAPIMAGLTALINADRYAKGKEPLGLLNPLLYAAKSNSFTDITSGQNGDYVAGPGYDLVTGLGSPVIDVLDAKLRK
jgi:kumamolisin